MTRTIELSDQTQKKKLESYMTLSIIVLTAEPKNFVPVEIEKAAIAKGITCEIVDVKKIIIEEALDGKLFILRGSEEDAKLVPLEYGPGTVVIPRLNEYHLDTKIGILQRMKNAGATLVNSPEGMSLCNDKLMSQVLLNNAGIRTPKSWVIQDAKAFDTAIKLMEEVKMIDFPIILKTFRGTHGIGVMKLDSRSALVSVGQTLLKESIDFMLQEFCKHDQSVRIIMKGQELLASNLRGQPKAKDEFRTNSHLGSETQPNIPPENELELAKKIVTLFGTNFCAIDYIVTKDDGVMVLEVNGSPGLEAISKNWPDKNLAAEIVDFAMTLVQVDKLADEPKPAAPELPDLVAPEPVDVKSDVDAPNRLNFIEMVQLHTIMCNPTEAKVDTGATTSSLHVDSFKVENESVSFKRGDSTFRVPLHYTRHVKNNGGGESMERPVVLLDISVKGKRFNRVAFSLNNRGHMKYEVLIGRNLIEMIGLPVEIPPSTETTDDLPASEIKEV